ncbi:MAG: 4'-phosphopantetheinyl transferase superfamily protein, partial [Candidatus Thermoplasmatota archaeon]|nr:4'-phosphopantetheinyl transferase superfamily protein [Candidatus Thermoplasmatota archaeon]
VDEAVAIQETNRIWVIKESVQKACGFGMHLPPQSFAVHEHEDITVNHNGQTYHIQTNHWVETLDDIPFQLGFSKVLGIS